MRKITFTFGKKRSYERYYEQYMNLIGMDNLEKSRSLIIEKIKRTAAKAGGDQSQREKERTIVETMKADIKGFENSLNREGDIAILIGVVTFFMGSIYSESRHYSWLFVYSTFRPPHRSSGRTRSAKELLKRMQKQ